MTKIELYKQLENVNATRDSRKKNAHSILEHTELFKPLLEILFMTNDSISIRAAWIFEFVCKKDLQVVIPYLSDVINNLSQLQLDSAIRPCAKILELLIEAYYKKKSPNVIIHFTETLRKKCVAVAFDWLIGVDKVATKAYSMTVLYYLGTEFEWVHPELKQYITQNYSTQSAGFKARSRYVLNKMD